MIPDAAKWSMRSVLISVSDLESSTNFYQSVMNLQTVLVEDQIAILANDEAGSLTLYLRQAQRNAARPGQQALGVRSVSYDVGTVAELDRIEVCLRAVDLFRDRRRLEQNLQTDVLRGHDPDRLALTFVASEGGGKLSVEDYREVLPLMYVMDV